MNNTIFRGALAYLNGKVYAVGGTLGGIVTEMVDVYDPVTDSWSECRDMQTARTTMGEHIFVYSVNERVYRKSNDVFLSMIMNSLIL